jgi:hypothetical protein
MLEKLSKSLPPLVGSVVCAVLLDLLSFLLFGSSSRSKDENLFAQLFFARFELFFLSLLASTAIIYGCLKGESISNHIQCDIYIYSS